MEAQEDKLNNPEENSEIEIIKSKNAELIGKIDDLINSNKIASNKNDDDFRRVGFFCSIDEFNFSQEKSIDEIILNHKLKKNENILKIEELYEFKKNSLEEKIKRLLKEVIDKKNSSIKDYIDNLDFVKIEIKEVETELKDLRGKLILAIEEISKSKEGIIKKRFSEMEDEVMKLIEIHNKIEGEQNQKFKSEYEEDKASDKKKIDFYENIKKDFEETYDDVKKRIKILNNGGINNLSSFILITVGFTSSLVAGWFFSLWTGPIPTFDENKGAVIGNSSIKFSIIDLVAKYTTKFGWIELILGIIFYVVLIGFLGFISYKLLKYFKFLPDLQKQKSNDELNFEINEEDNLLTGKLSGANFFSFWLKVSPLIIFIFLTIAVIAKEAFGDSGEDKFQELFDSLTNQAMGNLSAFVSVGFIYLYIIKILEPRYLKKSEINKGESGSTMLSWEISILGILFISMLISMILSRSTGQTQKIYFESFTISGYAFFVLITGFSISFGLRFIGLEYTYNKLLNYLTICTNNINRLSKSRRDFYTDNQVFNNGIIVLQHQMFNIIADRNAITNKIIASNDKSEEKPEIPLPIFIVQEKTDQVDKENRTENNDVNNKFNKTDGKNNPEGIKEESNTKSENVFSRIKNWMIEIWHNLESNKQKIKDNEGKNNNLEIKQREISKDDELYFPEISSKIRELQVQFSERTAKLKELEQEIEDYWINAGTYKKINNEIEILYLEIEKLTSEKNELGVQLNKHKDELILENQRQLNLIKEGYLTGKWFVKENSDLYLNHKN